MVRATTPGNPIPIQTMTRGIMATDGIGCMMVVRTDRKSVV